MEKKTETTISVLGFRDITPPNNGELNGKEKMENEMETEVIRYLIGIRVKCEL